MSAKNYLPSVTSGTLDSNRLGVSSVVWGAMALDLIGLACNCCLNIFLFRPGVLLELFRHLMEGLDFLSAGIALLLSRLLKPMKSANVMSEPSV